MIFVSDGPDDDGKYEWHYNGYVMPPMTAREIAKWAIDRGEGKTKPVLTPSCREWPGELSR